MNDQDTKELERIKRNKDRIKRAVEKRKERVRKDRSDLLTSVGLALSLASRGLVKNETVYQRHNL